MNDEELDARIRGALARVKTPAMPEDFAAKLAAKLSARHAETVFTPILSARAFKSAAAVWRALIFAGLFFAGLSSGALYNRAQNNEAFQVLSLFYNEYAISRRGLL